MRAIPQAPVPGQVTDLTTVTNPDGTIRLSWTAPDGGSYWYDVYMRDVTAGEADLTMLPLPVTDGTSMTAGYLTNNHVYEFKVAATNGRVGPLSAGVQASSHY
jgi:hypothetical protein